MKKVLRFSLVMLILFSALLVYAKHYQKCELISERTTSSNHFRPDYWIDTDSGFSSGKGVGQISIAMNDPSVLWAHAIDNATSILDEFTMSVDSGQTWTAGTFNEGDGLSQLFAINENICWAVFNTGADQGLYKTVDGGATWAKQGTAYGGYSFANVIHFFNDNDGFAQGDPVGGYYELYTTTNGGDSWTRVPEVNIPAPTTGEYGITGNYCAVGDYIWWGTNKGRIFRSSDKGYTWEVSMTAFGPSETVNAVFADELNGIVYRSYLNMGIEPIINITDNGGVTWSQVSVSGNMYARYFAYVPGTIQTYVGSSSDPTGSGASYSIDGGYSWITLNSGDPIQSSSWIDTETGWAGTWATATGGGMLIFDGNLGASVGYISGTVTDFDTSTPIEGATITLGSFSTTTNDEGAYYLQLEVGTYTLTCELEGYESYTQENVEIFEDETTVVDIQIQNLYNPPQDLTYLVIGSSNVLLSYQPPVGGFGLTSYNIYRNEAFLANTTNTFYTDIGVPPGTYTYYVTALYFETYESIPSNEVIVEIVVNANGILTPIRTELIGNNPNPFKPSGAGRSPGTTINFSLKEADYVTLEIYNIKGEKVRDLINDKLEASFHTAVWDGKDNSGKELSSGVYFYKMKAGGRYTSTKKMILMK